MTRIALVEDNQRLAKYVRQALGDAGIESDLFAGIETAWAAAQQPGYGLFVIDRGLPDGDGLLLVKRLRFAGIKHPCMILTARDALHDRVQGLEGGADDYLTKPFSMEELVARVRALLRRPATLQNLTPQFGDIEIRPQGGTMVCGTDAVTLAPAELQIMLSLVKANGETVRRTALEAAAWGLGEAVTPNALDVALHRLKRKLQAIGSILHIVNAEDMAMRSAKSGRLHSLDTQLLLTYVGALLLTVVVIAGGLWALLGSNQERMTRFDLFNETRLLKDSLRFDSNGRAVGLVLPNDASWIYEALPSDLKYRLLDANGRVVLTSDGNNEALAPAGAVFDSRATWFEVRSGGHRLNVRTVPLVRGATTYYLQAASSDRIALLARTVGRLLFVRATLQIVVVSIIVFSIAVFFTLRRVLKPLREASAAAARIEPRNWSARIAIRRIPVEFAPVIDAFNQALDRLENGYRVQQAFLEATAHELKTPLALLRAQIEMEGCADRVTLLRDIDQIARQVHQLLHLAEVSEARNYRFESTDVAAVAENVVDYLRRLAERRTIYLELCCTPTACKAVQADPAALHMLLKNVVENAIEHSPSGAVVAVVVDSDQVTIRDEGPGIADADLPHLFTRFWRGSARKSQGAGLGLAICQEIATAHRWHLSARNAGLGAEFVLRFGAEGRTPQNPDALVSALPAAG